MYKRKTHDEDITGKVFGRLTAIKCVGAIKRKVGPRFVNEPLWDCQCQCGEHKTVQVRYLLSGQTRSCGCLRRETAAHQTPRGFCVKGKGNKDPSTPTYLARKLYIQTYGDIPDDMIVTFLDGDKHNIQIDNLRLVNRDIRHKASKMIGGISKTNNRELFEVALDVCEIDKLIKDNKSRF